MLFFFLSFRTCVQASLRQGQTVTVWAKASLNVHNISWNDSIRMFLQQWTSGGRTTADCHFQGTLVCPMIQHIRIEWEPVWFLQHSVEDQSQSSKMIKVTILLLICAPLLAYAASSGKSHKMMLFFHPGLLQKVTWWYPWLSRWEMWNEGTRSRS